MDKPALLHLAHASSLIANASIDTRAPHISFAVTTPSSGTASSRHLLQASQIRADSAVLTPPTVNQLSSEAIKQELFEINSARELNRTKAPVPTVIPTGLSSIPMSNNSNHLMATLNSAHFADAAGPYFVTGLADLSSSHKMNPSSNTDLPSPSSSSNSSNPPSSSHHHHHHHHSHHAPRRHGEGGDPSRKREMRLQKNREAARECRRKKKEYIKCLEERVAGLEAQNKALIEELRQLKELYCQRDETGGKASSKNSTTSAR